MEPRRPQILYDARIANLLSRLRQDPDSREALLALAVGFNARSMPEEAQSACTRLLELDESDERAWHEAIIAHSFGGSASLEPLLPRVQKLVKDNPNAGWARRNLALLCYYLERDEETRAACEQALALDPADPRTHDVLAYLA